MAGFHPSATPPKEPNQRGKTGVKYSGSIGVFSRIVGHNSLAMQLGDILVVQETPTSEYRFDQGDDRTDEHGHSPDQR